MQSHLGDRTYDLLGVIITSPATCPRDLQFLRNDQTSPTLPRFPTEILKMSKTTTDLSRWGRRQQCGDTLRTQGVYGADGKAYLAACCFYTGPNRLPSDCAE